MMVKRKIKQKKRWQAMLLTLLMSVFSFVPSYSADSFINEQKSKNFSEHVWQFYGDTKKGIKRVIKNVSTVTVGSVVILGLFGAVFLGMPARAEVIRANDAEEEGSLVGGPGDGQERVEVRNEEVASPVLQPDSQPVDVEGEERPEEEVKANNELARFQRMLQEIEDGLEIGHPHYGLYQEFKEEYKLYAQILLQHSQMNIYDSSADGLRPILEFMCNGPSEDHPHYPLYQQYEAAYCRERFNFLTQHGWLLIDAGLPLDELEALLVGDRGQQEEEERQAARNIFSNFDNTHSGHPQFQTFNNDLEALEKIEVKKDKRKEYRALCLKYHPDKNPAGDQFYSDATAILTGIFKCS